MKPEEIIALERKRREEQQRLAQLALQAKQDAAMQAGVDDYIEWILDGQEETEERVPAIVELAGLVRKTALAKVMVPPNLIAYYKREMLKYLYREVEDIAFDNFDSDFWMEGTHELSYEGVKEND